MMPPVVSALAERVQTACLALWETATRHKRMAAAAAAVLLVGAAAGAWAVLRPPPPPPSPQSQSHEQIRRYMASRDFGRQSDQAKRQYMRAVAAARGERPRPTTRGAPLSDEQRARLRENVRPLFRQMARERMDKYFALRPEERTAYLDKMIDERMARRPQGRANRPPGGDRGRRRGPSPERLKRRIENTPPEVRAKRVEFMEALRERMKQRGIDPPAGPPRP